MRGPHVADKDMVFLLCLSEGLCLDGVTIQNGFNCLASRLVRGASVVGFQLEAVEHWRVVAGGDHDSSNGALFLHSEGNRRCRSRLGGQHDLETIASQYF